MSVKTRKQLTSIDLVGDGHEVEPRLGGAAVGPVAVGAAEPRPAVRVRLARLHLEQELAQRRGRTLPRDHAEQSCNLMKQVAFKYVQCRLFYSNND